MYFALPLVLTLGIWLAALLSGTKDIAVTSVLIGCVLAYATVALGRLLGFLPEQQMHLLFAPVLIGLGAAIVSPFLRSLPQWVTVSNLRVPITIELESKPERYRIGKHEPADAQTSAPAAAMISATASGDEDLRVIEKMNAQVQELTEFRKPANLKMPSPEEMKRLQRAAKDLLEGKDAP